MMPSNYTVILNDITIMWLLFFARLPVNVGGRMSDWGGAKRQKEIVKDIPLDEKPRRDTFPTTLGIFRIEISEVMRFDD